MYSERRLSAVLRITATVLVCLFGLIAAYGYFAFCPLHFTAGSG